ncbi:MepB family protein [Cellulophaga sp. 20_2_10]|uniref:MepB family protein n=1 Tax=Cellulophaga sp. 20_2_10 TaxID=2942476 RepID=UPI00201B0F6C|nr:MepB family protein [Cellulophaga sp. 20_2_10]MCL5244287.1 MepB family protein [Cellulophaga sp. 20_2_10]
MNPHLNLIKTKIYDSCKLSITNFVLEEESKEYDACRFLLNGRTIISRNAKITPKKAGQFVTFWKRSNAGPIEPFNHTDTIDFFIVNVVYKDKMGQFVFPRSILLKKGILSTDKKEGKRAFRVYPSWDVTTSKQALKTQEWQLNYFYNINDKYNLERVTALYS